jgi:hypothetical protein
MRFYKQGSLYLETNFRKNNQEDQLETINPYKYKSVKLHNNYHKKSSFTLKNPKVLIFQWF